MRHCYVLRVFTRGDDGGNPLGVVTDVTGLSDRMMQEIATDNGFSETIFIDWREPGMPSVRIFTPSTELPFAGHPLVGAAWVLCGLGPDTVHTMRCGVGEIPFHLEGDVAWVDTPMAQIVRPAQEAVSIAAAAGLVGPVASWWAEMPLPYLVMDLGSPVAVMAAEPELEALVEHGAPMTMLFADGGDHVVARFFAPEAGVPEDPATGSAAAALAAVRHHEGAAAGTMTVLQGDNLGHPSTIHVEWNDQVARLGGTVRRDEVRVLEK
jgi:trans-2,3-dihydro-3-hydroxyanthranilate isomerase